MSTKNEMEDDLESVQFHESFKIFGLYYWMKSLWEALVG
jgi:hypothetical protein